MSGFEVVILSVGVSLDAFAVSLSGAAVSHKNVVKNLLTAEVFFGGFQFLMPLLGAFIGGWLEGWIAAFDHWLAFILLAVVGGKMIYEEFSASETSDDKGDIFKFPGILVLAVATSIDALAVGVSLRLVGENVLLASVMMGIATFFISAAGVICGSFLSRIKIPEKLFPVLGGLAIIGIGVKILVEHLKG